MSYIFISYSHKDKDYAHKLYQYLFEHGFNAWIDDRIDYGSRWPDEVEKRVQECGAFILMMSSNSKQSDWVKSELHLAKQLNKTIYTFLLEGENWWHLHGIQYVDVRNGEMPSAKFIASLSKTVPEVKNISIHIDGNVQGNIIVGDKNIIRSEPVGRDFTPAMKNNNEEASHAENLTYETNLDLYKFIQIPKDKEVPYTFYIGKYPVTNAQYERFLNAPDFANPVYWLEFSVFDKKFKRIGDNGQEGITWLYEELKKSNSKVLLPRYWEDENFGKSNPNHPVVGISWYEANAYCEWLFQNWNTLLESKTNISIKPQSIRLPLEIEWQKTAGGIVPNRRYAWDESEKQTTSLKEILHRANVRESLIGHTTSVDAYPLGQSPYGVMDMSGNVWEWQANSQNIKGNWLGLRGGSWRNAASDSLVTVHDYYPPNYENIIIGFRVAILYNG